MLRLIIKSQKHGESWRDFNSQADIDAFLAEKGDHFGRLAYQEVIEEIKDDEGKIIQEAQVINHAATVEYIIQDVSEEYFEKENKKNKKNKRKQDIKDIKWNDINSIAEVKQILKLIVDELEEK